MRLTTMALLVAGLFVAAPDALAQLKVSGSVTGGVLGRDINSRNDFKLQEYRDLSSGASVGADITGESDQYHLRFFGENLGRDDQFAEFSGRKYGVFKYSLYNNNIIHNLTFNAITPFSGVGTNTLTFPGALGATPSTNTATWTPFDYSIKHENYGGTFELQSTMTSPYYFRATANRKDTRGIRPVGSPGHGPGSAVNELPTIVDYTTTDASAEAGYATKTQQFSVNLSYSKFQDNQDFMIWRNPAITNALTDAAGFAAGVFNERTTLAADNNLWKLALNGMWKQLPMSSTLALRGTYSRLTNELPVANSYTLVTNTGAGTATNVGNVRLTNPSSPVFNGDIVNKTLSLSLTSQPAKGLDSRLYWNWTEKENKSTRILYTPSNPGPPLTAPLPSVQPTTAGTCDFLPTLAIGPTCSTELFHYKKSNPGIDLGYRFDPQNKVSGGWDYVDTARERIDFDETKEHKLYVEWKNSSLDLLTGKIKFQRLQRRSDFKLGDINLLANGALGSTAYNNSFFAKYLKRFDLSDNDQDLVKLVLDSSPQPFLDLGAELIYKHNQYRNVTLGRNKDHREELYLTASYGDPKRFRVSAFFDYEQTYYNSTHWQGNPNEATFPTAISATQFLWTGKVKDKNYVVGLGADWPYSGRLKFSGSLIWQETDGTVDFQDNSAPFTPVNIGAYDSFRKWALNLKTVYAIDKNFDLTLGVAYENYKFNDEQLNGYNYTLVTGAGVTALQHLLSGAYAFPSYHATVGYLTLKYKFQ